MWQQWINLLLGIWVVISGYANFTPEGMATNLTITGIAIAALALWGALEHRAKHDRTTMRDTRESRERHA